MSTPNFSAQSSELLVGVTGRLTGRAVRDCKAHYEAAIPLLEWLDFLRVSEVTNHANELLDGLRASIIESMGCLAMGLVRPAIYAMRCQIDVAVAWLYFKDHPVEWEKVRRTGDGFIMKGDGLDYLTDCFPRFANRMNAMGAVKTRTELDPYRLLSAYVHAQSPATVPAYGDLKTLVSADKKCQEAVLFQKEVSEYLGDVFMAVFADKWASLPAARVASVSTRLGKDTAKVFST